MLDDAPSILLVVIIIILFVMGAIITCLCNCRKKLPKNEFPGLAGMVRIHCNCPDNISVYGSSASLSQHTRAGTSSTATRSLPELPISKFNGVVRRNNSVGTDTASELYATVEEKNSSRRISNTVRSFSDTSDPTTSSPYEQIKEEHQYAKVIKEKKTSSSNRCADAPSTSSDMNNNSSSPPPHPPPVIAAANAILGVIPANGDMPYMTPPLTQANFSGDSQESATSSAKGYTSISAREPLSRISAQRPSRVYHYAVISDDSDDNMYAAIQDAYNSGSEMYAQIQSPPPQELPINAPDETDTVRHLSHSRQASSSSACSHRVCHHSPSQVERRSVNSPLPPRPSDEAINANGMYALVTKRHSTQLDSVPDVGESSFVLGYESLRKCDSSIACYDSLKCDSDSVPGYEQLRKLDDSQSIGYRKLRESEECDDSSVPGYERLRKLDESDDSVPGYEELRRREDSTPGYEKLRDDSVPGYEELRRREDSIPGYEKLRDEPEPGYEGLREHAESDKSIPGYEELRNREDSAPGYEKLRNREDSVPGYEELRDRENSVIGYEFCSSDRDPNYEELRNEDDSLNHFYATIDKNKKRNRELDVRNNAIREPVYEKIRNENAPEKLSDHSYENLKRGEEGMVDFASLYSTVNKGNKIPR